MLTVSTTLLWIETLRLRRGADAQQGVDRIARAAEAKHLAESLAVARAASEAARVSADAALGVELPRLEFIKTHNLSANIEDDLRNSSPKILFRNLGRTPAYMLGYGIDFSIKNEPEELCILEENAVSFDRGCVCEPSQDITIAFDRVVRMQDHEVAAVTQGGRTLWVFGFVSYRDFLGGFWISEFRFFMDIKAHGPRFMPLQADGDHAGYRRYDPAKISHIRKRGVPL